MIPHFPNLFNRLDGVNINIYWPYNLQTGYIVYLFAGFIIQNNKFNKLFKYFIYILGVFSLFLRLIISHHLTIKYKTPDRTQINYVNLPIVVYSCSIFFIY